MNRRRPVRRRTSKKQGISTSGAFGLSSLFLGLLAVVGVMLGAVVLVVVGILGAVVAAIASAASRPPQVVASTKQRRNAVAAGRVVSGVTTMAGRTGCNSKCRNSRLPKRFCRCGCGGKTHGELRGPVAAVRRVAAPRARAPRPAALRKSSPPQRERFHPSQKRAIFYKARDGKEYQTLATPRQVEILRDQKRFVRYS